MKRTKARPYRRSLRYLTLALLPLLLLWGLITRQSREWALSITEQNAVNMLDKNAELINQHFASLRENLYLMMNDANINQLLLSSSSGDPLALQANERDLQSIIGQYISDADSICSIYIVSSKYSFCFFDRTGLPSIISPENLTYLEDIRKANSVAKWFPTTRYKQVINLGDRYGRYFSDFDVFSVGALMNLSFVKYGFVHNYASIGEQPVVLINLYPSLFDEWLASEHLLSNTSYRIYTSDQHLVYASEGLTNESVDPAILPVMTNTDIQSSYRSEAYGKSTFQCSRLLQDTGWTITSYTPVESAYFFFDSNIGQISIVVFFITAVFVQIVVRRTTRSISRPLDQLSTGLHQTAEGNYAYRITCKQHPDYQDTFHAYNSMNEHIDRLIKENYETQLSEKNLEIQLINMQFNPHFLYNTLNLISLMALENEQDQISDMLCQLSYMMRYSVDTSRAKVPLEEDIKYIDAYISLMQLRSNGGFSYVKEIEPMMMGQCVPKFMLQPFVENAVLHAFSQENHDYTLRIVGKVEEDTLIFMVMDNGKGMNQQEVDTLWKKDNANIGITNTHKRIQLYYGEPYGVTVQSTAHIGTVVTVRIPLSEDLHAR